MSQIYVVGHKNPDNDSIMAAYTWANLKNMMDPDNEYIPVRLGPLPAEAEMIFAEYGIEDAPALIDHVEEGDKVYLVDHNELGQAVDGIEKAEVVGVVDHHRIADLQTAGPIEFLNMPVGSTTSVITMLYGICGIDIQDDIAACLLSALLTDNTIESARRMADEGDRQLSVPGVLEGKVKPDYNKLIRMAASQALKTMLLPSVMALLIPILGGFLFGVEFVGGLLVGATIVAIPRAIFMGNSGGAFDNAKKYIESGALEGHGKGTPAHKAAVVGDTVGDTRKDVVGVALDIFIKTMSTVANTFATLFSHFTLIK